MTLRLYNQGMTPEQIAKERKISLGSILGHFTELIKEGKVDIGRIISAQHRQTIERAIDTVGTEGGLTPIKNICPEDISWEEIRMVLAVKPKPQ